MFMNFTAYNIYRTKNGKNYIIDLKSENVFNGLNGYPKIVEAGDSFAPLYVHRNKEFVLGTFVQSYNTVLTKFDDEKNTKSEVQLDDNEINDKTYFYINCEESRIYIQGKLYPKSLSKMLTIDRLRGILGEILHDDIAFVQAQIKYTIFEIDEIFSRSFVKRIAFKNLEGLEIPEGAVLHNPKKYLDDSLRETWNTYSKDNIDSMELKAKSGEKLSKNPLAKIGMILSKDNVYKRIFKSMDIMDDGEKIEIKPEGNEHKIIYISKSVQEDSYETYDRILKKTSKDYRGRFDE